MSPPPVSAARTGFPPADSPDQPIDPRRIDHGNGVARALREADPSLMTLATLLGLVLLGLVVTAWFYTASADLLSCSPNPPRLTALSFAGSGDRARSLLAHWSQGCGGRDASGAPDAGLVEAHLRSALRRDWFLIGAYGLALPYWLALGSAFERRAARKAMVMRLARLAPLAAVVDGLCSWFVHRWLDDQLSSGWMAAATVTAWLKWSIVLPSLWFAALYVASVGNRVVRTVVLGDEVSRPSFWEGAVPSLLRPTHTDPTSELSDPGGRRPGAGDRGESEQKVRFASPAGEAWPPYDDRPVSVALSGGGIRAAAYALGALQILQETPVGSPTDQPGGAPNSRFISSVRYLSTVSGGGFVGGAFQMLARMRARSQADGSDGGLYPEADDVLLGPSSPEYKALAASPQYLWSPIEGAVATADHRVTAQRTVGQKTRSTREFGAAMAILVGGVLANLAVVAALIFVASRGLGYSARGFLLAGDRAVSTSTVDANASTAGGTSSTIADGLGAAGWLGVMVASVAVTIAFHPVARRWMAGVFRHTSHDGRTATAAAVAVTGGGVAAMALALSHPWSWRWWLGFEVVAAVLSLTAILLRAVVPGSARSARWLEQFGPGAFLSIGVAWLAVHWYLDAWRSGGGQQQSILPLAHWLATISVGLVAGVAIAVLLRLKPLHDRVPPRLDLTLQVGAIVAGGGASATGIYLVLDRPGPDWGHQPAGRIWLVMLAALLVTYCVADQKMWSPHPFYKRRLAARFALYRSEAGTVGSIPFRIPTTLSQWAEPVAGLPEPLIGAAVYSSFQDEQGLAALPFVFSSSYVGGPDIGWMRTVDFEAALGRRNGGDATLLGAMAISGAAVSPAIGSVDVGSFGSLLSLLNGRLGVWLPSPRYVDELSQPGTMPEGWHPLWIKTRRFNYMLRELTGRYDPTDRFVYVTDGGQFDNLGVYTLLERRCPVIVAFDASGDLKPTRKRTAPTCRTFEELRAFACERLKIKITPVDTGITSVDVTSDAAGGPVQDADCGADGDAVADRPSGAGLGPLGEVSDGVYACTGRRAVPTSVASVAVFDVRYPATGDAREFIGTLVLAKAVVSDASSKDLQDYVRSEQGAGFPADSTIDQFLSSERFGRYVELGRDNATCALAALGRTGALIGSSTAPLSAVADTGDSGSATAA